MFRVLAAFVMMTVPAVADECVSLETTMQRAQSALTNLGLKAKWFLTTMSNGDTELVIALGGNRKPIVADFHAGCMIEMDGEAVTKLPDTLPI